MTFPFPVFVPRGWVNAAIATLNANGAANTGGYNVRVVIAASAISISGSQVRVRFVPVTSGANMVITDAFIGERAAAGDDYDFASSPTRLLFGGANGTTVTAGGASVTTDALTFAIDETKSYIISYALGGSSNIRFGPATGWNTYVKAAASADVATANVTGYTIDGTGNSSYGIDLIEVQ